jgi:hypothetical protein
MIVDTQITTQVSPRELGKIDSIMQDRPEHPIREAVVVFAVVLFGEIECDVANTVAFRPLRRNPGAGADLSAPAEPNAGFLFERRVDSDFKSACASLRIFVRNRDSVRNDNKMRQ